MWNDENKAKCLQFLACMVVYLFGWLICTQEVVGLNPTSGAEICGIFCYSGYFKKSFVQYLVTADNRIVFFVICKSLDGFGCFLSLFI